MSLPSPPSGGPLLKLILEEQQSTVTSSSPFGELNGQIHFSSSSLTFFNSTKENAKKLHLNAQERHLMIGRVIRKQQDASFY